MKVFITGITGTLGTALTQLHVERGDTVLGCARNESKAVEWIRQHGKYATFFLCSASSFSFDDTDLHRLGDSIDLLYHCAAMKHVDLCEEQPLQAFQQNVLITQMVTQWCHTNGVPCTFISSDKASLPTGVYGCTKLLGEKIALKYGAAAVRLGNLIASSGSVFQTWKAQRDRGEPITLTHPDMTRFFIPVREAVRFIADESIPGRVVCPRMMSATMGQIARTIGSDVKVIGMRPGETVDQYLIAPGDRGYFDMKGKKYVLEADGRDTFHHGVNSLHAAKWDTQELLREGAGVV